MSAPFRSNNSSRRVVITGMGLVSPLGNTLDSYWQRLCAGESSIQIQVRNSKQWPSHQSWLAAAVSSNLPDDLPGKISPHLLDDFARYAVLAAEQALQQAGKDVILERRQQVGVILGTAVGGDESRNEATYRAYIKQRPPSPQTIIRAMANGAVSAVSLAYGLQGIHYAVSSACASGTHAIGQAYQSIRNGCAELILAGGSEQLPSYSLYRSWQQMGVLSPDGCRPFCASRNGIILGEGAGVLVLESLASARARNATIHGEIVGFAHNASAKDWIQPDADTMAHCIRTAIQAAKWKQEEVIYINAHGTGTKLNDIAETAAIHQVFGSHASTVKVSSSKAHHGHTLGAAGALECIATVLALQHRTAPPNTITHVPDPDCKLNLITGAATPLDGDYALSHSFAFGGLNGVLALQRFQE
ncbi:MULTISPECIES: beta-ketoacyl-[acyl-carrier-protein] synthase family protein [unclassified Moorena]|uniref:beta-ketoacyl-[acyl-carrier-protein] synthase family protein n=1 Tax=unclassified Moorena TaxID=2683338 RepID=UPI0013C041A3|nr:MULTISPECIES: beta-ketoacyl-[acyl-carrier-protein] synthase family protein [unclassified Moorena]NEO04185.1 beta-ketoacyl-[acyl-carrier-protein] synthase family protein [Moorena sp. SIO3I8]NEO21805.1 beta-ketoacyl-[acyl-carrier-protein] synthase family protein [Moorena sp. SIO4A5]NEQ57918.1 beta-ketoacyl-[acyl-carrier-protein] synthase family protein [Moorena sp. SIO4A1]